MSVLYTSRERVPQPVKGMDPMYTLPASAERAIDDAFATNYYLSDEYGRECDECRGRGLSLAAQARIRRKWQKAWEARTGNTAEVAHD